MLWDLHRDGNMKRLLMAAVVGLASIMPATAQYGGRDYGYEPRDRGYDDGDRYRGRSRGYDDRDDDDYGRRGRGRGGIAFDEDEYLRCNPDVRLAVRRGKMQSGEYHYLRFGRGENRRLRC